MLINGRVSAGNTCELPNNTRVDVTVVLFGAGAEGEDIYIDVSISCVECGLSFANAITAKEKEKNNMYKAEVGKFPNCEGEFCQVRQANVRKLLLHILHYRIGLFLACVRS